MNLLTEVLNHLPLTPPVFDHLLRTLPDEVVRSNEGPDTWSPFDVVGHLIHAEKNTWKQRIEIILQHGESMPFPQFDRFAQFEASKGKSMVELLDEFTALRPENVKWLKGLNLTEQDLTRTGIHASFGQITLGNLLATWPAHDMTHIYQVCRVLGKRFKEPMGPWIAFNRLVNP